MVFSVGWPTPMVGALNGLGPRKHSDRTQLYSETAREAQSPEAARADLRLGSSQS